MDMKSEIVFGVVVRDVLHHLFYPLHLARREFARFNIASEHFTKDATEILMTGIADKPEAASAGNVGGAAHLSLLLIPALTGLKTGG